MFEKASIYKFYIQCNISTLFSCLCKIQRLYPILNIELRCVLYYILPRYRIAMVYILIKMLFRTIIRCYALYSLFSLADLTIFVLSFFSASNSRSVQPEQISIFCDSENENYVFAFSAEVMAI